MTTDETTAPPSPDRPEPQRAVTAPDLALTLEQLSTTGLESERTRLKSIEEQERKLSGASSTDKLNDLGEHQHKPPPEKSQSQSIYNTFRNPPALPSASAWRTYFFQEVAGDKYLEFQLLLMTMVTGALDAMTFTQYRVFASKMTGNTLFLALYAFRLPALDPGIEKNVGISIGVFIFGAIFFGHLGHVSRQRRRIWLLISNSFQAILMLAAAAIRYWVSRNRTGSGAMAIIACLAFAESGQIANALNVSMPELNTTMITGALIQLCTDKDIFKVHNTKRNRRLAFFTAMLAGCFIGTAVLAKRSPSAVIVVVAAMKGALVISFLFNRGLVEKKMQLEDGHERIQGAITPASRVLWGD
ncbi:hypothetical protein AC579_3647 [Pseudocercospora musae]|uniref:DUF1275 domain protein n=1 Tax=Pseudocercospora musae TaxID=113226 RepID=A0A139IST4_9PEZI|nr:hypothetical protein AC579_3647 [Pseudocercospora musae]